jgi:hypothetical protein
MGWISTTYVKQPSQTMTDWFIGHGTLRWTSDRYAYRVLKSALKNRTTYYAAIEQKNVSTGEVVVFAVVILCRFGKWPGGHNFGWKDMDETAGPNEDNCPESILKLLTPTSNEYANDWRRRCWEKIQKKKARPKIEVGTKLLYGGTIYTVEKKLGRRGYAVTPGFCRMRVTQAAKAEIVL